MYDIVNWRALGDVVQNASRFVSLIDWKASCLVYIHMLGNLLKQLSSLAVAYRYIILSLCLAIAFGWLAWFEKSVNKP